MVTHSPNIAVVCDVEQIIHAFIDRSNKNQVIYTMDSIESPQINKYLVDDEIIMFGGQPLECAPAHPPRLAAFTVQDARLPAQPRPKPVSPPCRTPTCILA